MATSVNSSTSTASTSTLSAKTGVAGLVSGLDTDSLVTGMTSADNLKITKEQQKLQSLQWKQTAFRGVSKTLKEFQTKYLDVLSSTNMRSTSTFSTVTAATSSTKVGVSATSGAGAGTITINNISQLATNQTITGKVGATTPIVGSKVADTTSLLGGISATDSKSFLLKLDGKVRTITMDEAFITQVNGSDFQTALQAKINGAFGTKSSGDPPVQVPIINVSMTGGVLGLSATGSQVTVNALNSDTTTLDYLGVTDGQTDRLATNSTLASLKSVKPLDAIDEFKLSINSVDFTFQKTDSLATIMSRVNSSTAGVTMAYSSITDKFTLTAKESGAGDNIVIKDTTGNLANVFGLSGTEGADMVTTQGLNAVLSVDGQSIVRSSNSVEIDGVKINLLEKSTDPITISKTANSTSLTDTIKNFVTDYNNMINMVNSLVKETPDKDFKPLTDEQKKSMSATQITDWETKAKVGLLSNDSILKGVASKMQSLIYGTAVKGGISLYDIGITSAGYTENGKLKIDEAKLKTALETKGSAVQELFTTEKTGLAQQLNDAINGAIKTTGAKGTRGSLIEMAGYEATVSNTENTITSSITKTNKSITTLKAALKAKEASLWSKFTAMETSLSKLNTQSSMIASFGSSGA